jgi:hypothetical protein
MNGRKKMKGMMTKYFCPDCQVNLCIVPCFQAYHKDLVNAKFNGANQNPSNDRKNDDDSSDSKTKLTSHIRANHEEIGLVPESKEQRG